MTRKAYVALPAQGMWPIPRFIYHPLPGQKELFPRAFGRFQGYPQELIIPKSMVAPVNKSMEGLLERSAMLTRPGAREAPKKPSLRQNGAAQFGVRLLLLYVL